MLQVAEILVNKMNMIITFMELTIGEVARDQIMQDLVVMLRSVRFI